LTYYSDKIIIVEEINKHCAIWAAAQYCAVALQANKAQLPSGYRLSSFNREKSIAVKVKK